jgi:hypothetical protein
MKPSGVEMGILDIVQASSAWWRVRVPTAKGLAKRVTRRKEIKDGAKKDLDQ